MLSMEDKNASIANIISITDENTNIKAYRPTDKYYELLEYMLLYFSLSNVKKQIILFALLHHVV